METRLSELKLGEAGGRSKVSEPEEYGSPEGTKEAAVE